MTEIDQNVFVGDMNDFKANQDNPDFCFVQAAKMPFHSDAVGYGKGIITAYHPEYLVAVRGNGIALNMVDSDYHHYFSLSMFDISLKYIEEKKLLGKKVLIHCNEGKSRAPSIGLLYLAKNHKIENRTYRQAKEDFEKIYPEYHPNTGVRDFLNLSWNKFIYVAEYEN